MASDTFNSRFFRAVLFAPLSLVPLLAIAAIFDIRQNYQMSAFEWYIWSIGVGAKYYLPVAYVGMLSIGIPVHITLKKIGQCHAFNYMVFGLGGGLIIGAIIAANAWPIGPIVCTVCGLIVSSVFWLLIRDDKTGANAI